MSQRDWEIPAYYSMKSLDQSDFRVDGLFSSPLYMWLGGTPGEPVIRLSSINAADETIDLQSAQDVDDLIKRLERAKRDVFGESQ